MVNMYNAFLKVTNELIKANEANKLTINLDHESFNFTIDGHMNFFSLHKINDNSYIAKVFTRSNCFDLEVKKSYVENRLFHNCEILYFYVKYKMLNSDEVKEINEFFNF